jgi:hypothetical protein
LKMKNAGPCCQCKSEIWLPDALYEAAQHGRGTVTFYCPYGHPQVFAKGETDLDKMRRERDRLAQQVAERDDEVRRQRELREGTERQLSATRGVVTRIKNRVGHGVCPCCNRTFENLARHMASKHADYAQEAAE